MKTYYAIKSGSQYFAGWNKAGPRLRSKPSKDHVYPYRDSAKIKIENNRRWTDGISDEFQFWKNAKIVKLSLIEA